MLWSYLGTCTSSSFCEFVFDNNLDQLVAVPTHDKGNILDLVFTDTPHIVHHLSVENHVLADLSDHFLISFAISIDIEAPKDNYPSYIFDYSKTDFDQARSYLWSCDFYPCLSTDDIEFIWTYIKAAITTAIDLSTPRVKLRSKEYPKWSTSETRHLSNCTRTLRRRVKTHPTDANQSKLTLYESHLREKLLSAKQEYEFKLVQQFAGCKNGKIYKYMNSLLNHSSLPTIMYHKDLSVATDPEKAEAFNSYFFSVYTTSDFILPPNEDLTHPATCISDITISPTDVLQSLTGLNPSKAKGFDGIGPKILRECAHSLYIPLHHLFTKSLGNHSIPQEWKIHQIVPTYKSGDKQCIRNYRPISLLCCVSKVLERLVYDKISDFVVSSISPAQFGFLPNRSCLQQLLLFLNFITSTPKACVDVIYLDFRKAFDSVPHKELLFKLYSLGITGNIWKWIEEYLTGRKQCVSINNNLSGYLPVTSGVPQGSILGPLFFIAYINDISQYISFSKLFLFADDAKLTKIINSLQDNKSLQEDLCSFITWSSHWNLFINYDKTFLLRLFSSYLVHEFTYESPNSSSINIVTSQKDLGIYISSDLSWTHHHNTIVAKAYKMLGLLRRTFGAFHSITTKKQLYLTLVCSQLTYCSQLWRPQLTKDITSFERVQRRATKFILNDYDSDYKSRLITLNVLPLMMRYELADILFFIKSLKNPTANFNITDFVIFSCSSTRSSTHNKLQHVRQFNNRDRHFYFCRLPRLWNSLPPLNIESSVASLKRQLKSIFYNHFLENFDSSNPCTYHYSCPCCKCMHTPHTPLYN